MAENKKEIETDLVNKLKNSFPDMLDFNNCLKELRDLWKLSQKQEFENNIREFKDEMGNTTRGLCSKCRIKFYKELEELKQKLGEMK